jgi:hypothetical protein
LPQQQSYLSSVMRRMTDDFYDNFFGGVAASLPSAIQVIAAAAGVSCQGTVPATKAGVQLRFNFG